MLSHMHTQTYTRTHTLCITWHRGTTALLLSTDGSVGKACSGMHIAKWLCGKNTQLYTHTHTKLASASRPLNPRTYSCVYDAAHSTLPFLLMFSLCFFSAIWTGEKRDKKKAGERVQPTHCAVSFQGPNAVFELFSRAVFSLPASRAATPPAPIRVLLVLLFFP